MCFEKPPKMWLFETHVAFRVPERMIYPGVNCEQGVGLHIRNSLKRTYWMGGHCITKPPRRKA